MRVTHLDTTVYASDREFVPRHSSLLRRFIFTLCVEKSVQLIAQVVCWPKAANWSGSSEWISRCIAASGFAAGFRVKDEFICHITVFNLVAGRNEITQP